MTSDCVLCVVSAAFSLMGTGLISRGRYCNNSSEIFVNLNQNAFMNVLALIRRMVFKLWPQGSAKESVEMYEEKAK